VLDVDEAKLWGQRSASEMNPSSSLLNGCGTVFPRRITGDGRAADPLPEMGCVAPALQPTVTYPGATIESRGLRSPSAAPSLSAVPLTSSCSAPWYSGRSWTSSRSRSTSSIGSLFIWNPSPTLISLGSAGSTRCTPSPRGAFHERVVVRNVFWCAEYLSVRGPELLVVGFLEACLGGRSEVVEVDGRHDGRERPAGVDDEGRRDR